MLDKNWGHVEKSSVFFSFFLFSHTSYYFTSWKRFWSLKNVYKMKREIERKFLCFRGFGWKFLLAWNFYGHKGISCSLTWVNLGAFSQMGYIYWPERDDASDWVPAVQAMKWLQVFLHRGENWVGSLSTFSGGGGLLPMALREGGLLTGPPTRQAFVSSEERELGAQGQGVADATW